MTHMNTSSPLRPSGLRLLAAAVSISALLAASGCDKLKPNMDAGLPLNSMAGEYKQTDAQLFKAANDAVAAGNTAVALDVYGKLYKRHPHNENVGIGYAQFLRKSGKAQQAADVLLPFTLTSHGQEEKTTPAPLSPQLANELAADYVALGRFDEAKALLTPVIDSAAKNPWRDETANLMGVVLDAQGDHAQAEKMFRAALDGWKGDRTSVMNNLALCLASQGKFDESLTILRKALLAAPNNVAVARNIQIVTDLRKNVVPKAPVKLAK